MHKCVAWYTLVHEEKVIKDTLLILLTGNPEGKKLKRRPLIPQIGLKGSVQNTGTMGSQKKNKKNKRIGTFFCDTASNCSVLVSLSSLFRKLAE